MFTAPLPNSGRPIVERVCFGNVFTDPMPSNGYSMRHSLFKATVVAYFKLSRYFLGMNKEIHKHTQRNLCHYSLFSDPASNPHPPEYRAGMSTVYRDILPTNLIDL